jgi:capsular exopolysaccharide synthesis family protein
MANYEINLRDYIRILRKRKSVVIFSTLAIGLFSFTISYLKRPEPTYKSIASVKIEKSGTMTGLYLETVSWSTEDYLATQAEIIKSFPIIEKVAQELGYIADSLSSGDIRKNPDYVNLVTRIQGQVSTRQQGETNIIDISVISDDPEKSKKLANTVATVYIRENTQERNKRAINALKFIENQLQLVGQRLSDAEETVRKYREETNLITLEYEAQAVLDELREAELKHNQFRREREELQLLLKQIERNETLPEGALADFAISGENSSLAELKRRLTEIKLERENLLIGFTEKHPAVLELETKIAEIKKSIINELKSLEESYLHKEKAQQKEVERLRTKYRSLPKSGLELARLQRQVNINDEVYSFLASKRQEALIQNAERIEEATLVRPALRGVRINPPTSTRAVAFVGLFIGSILGVVFAFVYETLDTSIGTIEDVEKFLNLPVIGVVPFINTEEIIEKMKKDGHFSETSDRVLQRNAHLISHFAPKSSIAESYRAVRTYLLYLLAEKNIKSIMITSSSTKEGKSTTAVNLALTLAQIGKRTLLVDADLRKPRLATIFGLDKEPGLSNIILGTCKWRDSVKTVTDIMMGKSGLKNIMMMPGIDNLEIITSGSVPLNPSELLNSQSMTEFIHEVEQEYEIVIIDTTPVLPAADAVVLASKIQGVVLIYQVGKIARGALKRTKTQLENVNANILGVVLNGLKAEISPDFRDFRYGEYYAYGGDHSSSRDMEDVPIYKKAWQKITNGIGHGGKTNETNSDTKQKYGIHSKKQTLVKTLNGLMAKTKNNKKLLLLFVVFMALVIGAIVARTFVWGARPKSQTPTINKDHAERSESTPANVRKFPYQTLISKDLISNMTEQFRVYQPLMLDKIEPEKIDFPYVLRVNQFENKEIAKNQLMALKLKGLTGFIELEYLESGKFRYNLYIIGFQDLDAAREVEQILESEKGSQRSEIQRKPFILCVRRSSTYEKFLEVKSALEEHGYFPYLIQITGDGKLYPEYMVAVGAFASTEEALLFKQMMRIDKIESEVIVLAKPVNSDDLVQN